MLKKILEEIETKKNKCLDIVKIEVDPMEITINREQYKGLRMAEDIIRKHMNDGKDVNVPTNDGWNPVEDQDRLPKDDEYILLSFENFDLPMVGRYKANKEGGAFYLGDCDEEDTCISQDLYVNAWQPLPKPYRPEKGESNGK